MDGYYHSIPNPQLLRRLHSDCKGLLSSRMILKTPSPSEMSWLGGNLNCLASPWRLIWTDLVITWLKANLSLRQKFVVITPMDASFWIHNHVQNRQNTPWLAWPSLSTANIALIYNFCNNIARYLLLFPFYRVMLLKNVSCHFPA